MGFAHCQNPNGPCVISPMSRRQLPDPQWGGEAEGRKAAAVPATGCVYFEKRIWNANPLDGRAYMYFHEVGHLEGAECEPCADHRAGEWLRQVGWGTGEGESEDGALVATMAILEHRSPEEAARNLMLGLEASYGLDGKRVFSLSDFNRATMDGYRDGERFDLKLVEVVPGGWFSEDTAQDWASWFEALHVWGIPYSINYSFRTMDQQKFEWDKRHTELWDVNPDAPRNDKWYSEGPAARPGHSEHQQGIAVDVSFPRESGDETEGSDRNIAARLAETYGIFRDAAAERWHFAHGGSRRYPLAGVGDAEASDASGAPGSEANPDADPGKSNHGPAIAAAVLIALLIALRG